MHEFCLVLSCVEVRELCLVGWIGLICVICMRSILVKLVIYKNRLETNQKLQSVYCGYISDKGLHWIKQKKKRASLTKILTHKFGMILEFFVPRRHLQFSLKSHAKASISLARPWKSPYNLQIIHTNWRNAFSFEFSLRFEFVWSTCKLVMFL